MRDRDLWSSDRYLDFADERSRPFAELIARIDTAEAEHVVDLGCGPGHLMPLLRRRWPGASLTGVDSSADMVGRARTDAAATGAAFVQGDVVSWCPETPPDVVISNATLQWLPDQLEVLARWASWQPRWMAIGVPGNFAEPSHVLRRELQEREPYRRFGAGLPEPTGHSASVYASLLRRAGYEVDAWETTYLHRLDSAGAVVDWISGTSARPILTALPDEPERLRARFVQELTDGLAEAYPIEDGGVTLPFRRVFVVGRLAS